MTDLDQKQFGKTVWNIADTLRGGPVSPRPAAGRGAGGEGLK